MTQMRGGGFHQFPKSRESGEKTPFEWTFSMPMWEYLRENPQQRLVFDTYMAARRDGLRPNWFEIYPAAEELSPTAKDNDHQAVLLVDVGGNHGYEIVKFRNHYPNIKGRFILQDLPETLAGIKSPLEAIEAMPYNFFTPQPVSGVLF